MSTDEHDPSCAWGGGGRPCRRFSTDGTALGAEIAHTMGTTDEDQIVRDSAGHPLFVSDVDEEQTEWESDRMDNMAWGSDVPVSRRRIRRRVRPYGEEFLEVSLDATTDHEPPPYPSDSLEWTEPRVPGTETA